MKYKPYPAYKDSGVDWLGGVPVEWEAKPLKRLSSCNDDVLPESTDAEIEIEYVDISSVSSEGGIEKTDLIRFDAAPSRARRKVRAGDVIISTVRTYLKAIASVTDEFEHVVVSTGFAVIRPKNGFEPPFARYALHANYFMDQVVAESVGVSYPAINASELAAIKVAVPSPSEQTAIATFLDRETAKLDTLIAKQEKLIELLQEKRQALISHAVTKGLNPDAPMKDSGVEWLPLIPENWNTLPLRFVATGVDSVFIDGDWIESKDLSNEGIRYITTGNVGEGFYKEQGSGYISDEKFIELDCTEVMPGDVLISRLNLPIGRACLVPNLGARVVTSVDNVIVRPGGHVVTRYLVYLLTSKEYFAHTEILARGATMQRISRTTLGNIRICLPSVPEQEDIATFLDQETAKLDILIEKSRRSIELMREHRTALISAAVTGKVDVREAA